jgi:hypothetical protein
MEYMRKLAEEKIREAMDQGVFDNLPGKGKPLNLDDDGSVPEDMRLAFKILKNAGCLPIEMEVRKEMYSLRQLLNATVDEAARRELRRELNFLLLKDALHRR